MAFFCFSPRSSNGLTHNIACWASFLTLGDPNSSAPFPYWPLLMMLMGSPWLFFFNILSYLPKKEEEKNAISSLLYMFLRIVSWLNVHFLIIAELLGFDNILIPSYATTRGQDILKGVNYASGAAGIRSESGQQMVTYYPNLLRQTLHKTRDEVLRM